MTRWLVQVATSHIFFPIRPNFSIGIPQDLGPHISAKKIGVRPVTTYPAWRSRGTCLFDSSCSFWDSSLWLQPIACGDGCKFGTGEAPQIWTRQDGNWFVSMEFTSVKPTKLTETHRLRLPGSWFLDPTWGTEFEGAIVATFHFMASRRVIRTGFGWIFGS